PLGDVPVPNTCTAQDLENAQVLRIRSWNEMLDSARQRMNLLVFSDDIHIHLQPKPFHLGIADRIIELLGILQSIAVETREDGSLTPAGMEILQNRFV